jgi:hypothetical protein
VLMMVLVGSLASDLWSSRALRGVLLDAGEVAEIPGVPNGSGGAQS